MATLEALKQTSQYIYLKNGSVKVQLFEIFENIPFWSFLTLKPNLLR